MSSLLKKTTSVARNGLKNDNVVKIQELHTKNAGFMFD